MTVVLDDHLLRDWMARRDEHLTAAVAGEDVATSNLWYARLCRSAARATGGGLLSGWEPGRRRALMAGLETHKGALARTVSTLGATHARMLGIVFNKVEDKGGNGYGAAGGTASTTGPTTARRSRSGPSSAGHRV